MVQVRRSAGGSGTICAVADEFDERIRRLLRPGGAGPEVSDELVRDAERQLRVRLPVDLVSLLRIQNGGYVRDEFSVYPTSRATSWADDHVVVNEIAGIGSEGLSLLESPALNAEWEQPDELVLLSGDGHWWIALDYRERGREAEPPVVFYENGSDGAPDDLRLADSFREFVCGLVSEPQNDEEVLKPGQIKSVWIDPDFARENGLDTPEDASR